LREQQDRIEETIQGILKDRYHFKRLIGMYGAHIGLDISNVLTAWQLGMIPADRVAEHLRKAIESHFQQEGLVVPLDPMER